MGSRTLTEDESILLRLGLKFIQVPSEKYFSGAVNGLLQDIGVTFEKYIWPKSRFFTRAQDGIMVKVLLDIKNMIHNMEVHVRPPKLNLSQRLKVAFKSLKDDSNIIISKADKGDMVAVLDSEHYHGLAAKHLADSQTYELLETDPLEEIVLRYHQYLERCIADGYCRRLSVPSFKGSF